jgi:hypothetical protein
MYGKITRVGINPDPVAMRLHHMIAEGYRNRHNSGPQDVRDLHLTDEMHVPKEKEKFLESVEHEENEILIEGFTYA